MCGRLAAVLADYRLIGPPLSLMIGVHLAVGVVVNSDRALALDRWRTFHMTPHRDRLFRRDCGSEERVLEAPNFLG
jgi:hypothetical protein